MNSFRNVHTLLTVNGRSIQFDSWDTFRVLKSYLELPVGGETVSELASSPCSRIRLEISGYSGLTLETIGLLLDDPAEGVVYRAVTSRDGEWLRLLSQQQIENLISRSPKIAKGVACHVDKLLENPDIDRAGILTLIAGYPDPCVRRTLAENPGTPEEFLETLAADSDIDVAQRAKTRLNRVRLEVRDEQLQKH